MMQGNGLSHLLVANAVADLFFCGWRCFDMFALFVFALGGDSTRMT